MGTALSDRVFCRVGVRTHCRHERTIMSKKKLDFSPNEFVVYPAHGVGKIVNVERQEVAGFDLEMFVISFEKDKIVRYI